MKLTMLGPLNVCVLWIRWVLVVVDLIKYLGFGMLGFSVAPKLQSPPCRRRFRKYEEMYDV